MSPLVRDAKRTFATPEGERFLRFLREEFYDRDLSDADPIVMATRVGEHRVVRGILELLEEPDE